jgi:hypothetical protein
MADDEVRMPARITRLASPVGLVLAGLCLFLPFVSASCASPAEPRVQWQVTYTGADMLTGGRPDVAFTDDADAEPMRRLDDDGFRKVLGGPPAPLPSQPVAWLAVAILVASLAAWALPWRTWRTTLTGGLALAAAIVLAGATILARHDATDAVAAVLSRIGATAGPPLSVPELREWESYAEVSKTFRYAYGFWLAILALSAVGVANTVEAVRHPPRSRDRPS